MKKERRNSFCVPSLPPLGNKPQDNKKPANAARPPLPPGHFLRDINLDGNLLDIPDPPSPPKRSSRRQSSPALRPLPLHDRTNEESAGEEPAAATTGNKRSRKSLCHVPSPATESNNQEMVNDKNDGADSSPVNQTVMQEQAAKTPSSTLLESFICFDDDVVVSSSKRQKRRESMILPSVMAPFSMEEETSDDSLDNSMDESSQVAETLTTKEDATMELADKDVTNTAKTASKRRLSIVLPSDIASFQEEVTSKLLASVETEREDGPMEEETAASTQYDISPSPRKAIRNSKRQSMMLPTDASLLQDDEAKAYFGQLQSVQMEESKHETEEEGPTVSDDTVELASTDKTVANTQAAMGADYIRSLVRQYCSLPLSGRNESKQAEEIERLTGYALVPPAAKRQIAKQKSSVDLNWSGSPSADGDMVPSLNTLAKRELLLKLGEMVDLMDKRKNEDTQQMEASTGCRVERTRNGKYRYYNIFTNRKMKTADYEELYLAAVLETKAEMSKRIQEWLRENENDRALSAEEEHEQCAKLSALVKNAQQPIEQAEKQQVAFETVEYANGDDRAASESDMEESPLSETENFNSSKNDSPMQMVVEQAKEEADTSCMEEGDTSILSLEEDASVEVEQKAASLAKPDALVEDVSESSEVLLPFPSREDTSEDSEIAAAEQRLWTEIDEALERYSRRVIEIREARAAERNE